MMPVPWKLWEGQVVDLFFPLRRYMGGTQQSAVFLTQYGDPEPRNAAIKLVLAGPRDAELTAQWDRAAQLSHPNLLSVLKRGTCQVNHLSLHYLVTEYAEVDLAEVLAERPLTPSEVGEMLEPLLDALSYIHSQGFVHGHVKPANVMAVNDRLKLSVDGITTVAELDMASNVPGPYDPPEFAHRGRSPIGDVWSFGMTLVEALTRQLPRPVGPKQEPILPESLPPEFLPMVRASLRPDPRKRASLEEIRAQIPSRSRAGVEAPAEPAEATHPSSRRWVSLALVGAAAVALAGIFVVPRMFNASTPAPVPSASMVQAATDTGKSELTPVVQTAVNAKPSPLSPEPVAAPVHEPAPPASTAPESAPPPTRTVAAKDGQIIRQVMPEFGERERKTIHGKFRIDILATVDASGHVTSAKAQSQRSKYFTNLTVKAVEQWVFEPKEGTWLLRFELSNKTTEVKASKAQ